MAILATYGFIFPFDFLVLHIQSILDIVLLEAMSQILGAKYLPPEGQDFGEIIVISTPVSTKPSISLSFIIIALAFDHL